MRRVGLVALALLCLGRAPGAAAASTEVQPAEEEVTVLLHSPKSEYSHVLTLRVFPLRGVATVSTLTSDLEIENDRAVDYAVTIPKAPFEGSIDVSLPGLGQFVGQIAPGNARERKPAQKGCTGPDHTVESTTFGGDIDFRGAGNYGQWAATQAEAVITRSPQLTCKNGAAERKSRPPSLFGYLGEYGPFLPGPDDVRLFGRARTEDRFLQFLTLARGGLTTFAAIDDEWLRGEIAAQRWVVRSQVPFRQTVKIGPGRDRPASATVLPPAPLFGKGVYLRRTHRLTGSLGVKFLGLTLHLTARPMTALLEDEDVRSAKVSTENR